MFLSIPRNSANLRNCQLVMSTLLARFSKQIKNVLLLSVGNIRFYRMLNSAGIKEE